MGQAPNNRPTVLGWQHHWQQGTLTDSKNDLSSTSAHQMGIPVAQDGVWLKHIWLRLSLEPLQELFSASKCEQSYRCRAYPTLDVVTGNAIGKPSTPTAVEIVQSWSE
jgi:hypothetical protein